MQVPRSGTLAARATALGGVDARVKLLLTLLYTLAVVAVPLDKPWSLLPLAIPLALALGAGEVPLAYTARRLLLGLPFVALVIAFPLLLDRRPWTVVLGSTELVLTSGVLRATVVAGKFVLAFSAAIVLTATTGFASIVEAMARLRLPSLFVSAVGLVWRYLFLCVNEATRMRRARSARCPRRMTMSLGWRSSAGIVGGLFLRALGRSERIHAAMMARGFGGDLPERRRKALSRTDWIVLVLNSVLLGSYIAFVLSWGP